MSEDVGFNSNIKDSSIKDGVDGDEVLKDSNLAIFIILIYVGFNSNIKDSSIKDGVDGDEVLKDSNMAIFIILIYVCFIFYFWLPIHFLYPFGLFLVSDSFFCYTFG